MKATRLKTTRLKPAAIANGPGFPTELDGLPVAFEKMKRRHLDGIWSIESTRADSSWTRKTFADEMTGRDRHYVVAIRGDEVIAYAGLLVVIDEGHITTIAVAPAWRRRGLGAALLSEAMTAARTVGCVGATLEVRDGNTEAVAMYGRFGFVVEGRRPAYYPDGSDALVMWRRDLAAGEALVLDTTQGFDPTQGSDLT